MRLEPHGGPAFKFRIGLTALFSLVCVTGQDLPLKVDAPWLTLTRLAQQQEDLGLISAEEKLRREALSSAEQTLGQNSKEIAVPLANLGGVLHREGRDREADPLLRRALTIAIASADKLLLALVLQGLGNVLAGQGELARAEPVLRRSLALFEQTEGEDALDTAKAENNLAALYSETHRQARAEELMTRALPSYEKHLGTAHPAFAVALSNMFMILFKQRRAREGEQYLRRALIIGETSFPGTAAMAHLQLCLAWLEVSRGNLKAAARILQEAIELQERTLGPSHPAVGRSLADYSAVLLRLHEKVGARQAANRANLILKGSNVH